MFSINPKLMGNNLGIGGATNMLALLKQEIDNLKAGTDEQKDEAVKLQNKYDKLKSLSTLIQDYAANLDTLESAPAEQQEG
jgi:FtsZ-binding cell division protein ZapB